MAGLGGPRPLLLTSNPYTRLGLAAGASATDIRIAHRALAKRFHPDRAGEGSLADFLEVQAAYESLIAQPQTTVHPVRRATSGGWTRGYQQARGPRPRSGAARAPKWRDRETGWAGGHWYWEGLRANAAKRARSARTA
jgi:hypothetical protein